MAKKIDLQQEVLEHSKGGAGRSAGAEIAGEMYERGDTVEFDGESYTFEETRQLETSNTSGVEPGTYPVVWAIVSGGRKVYRAVVNGVLYPIRRWNAPGQTIAKIRGANAENTGKRRGGRMAAMSARSARSDEGIHLSREASGMIAQYIDLGGDSDRNALVSEAVVTHVGPLVEKQKAMRAAIEALPQNLLERLAGADEHTRNQVLALLGERR